MPSNFKLMGKINGLSYNVKGSIRKKNPSGSTKLVWNWSLPEGLSARGLLSAGLTAKQCINLKAMPCTDTQHLVVGFMLKMLSMKPVLKVAQTSHS